MTYCLPIPVHGSAPTEQGQASRSTANQLIVFGVGADPDPFHDAGFQEAERPVMVSDPHCHQILAIRQPPVSQ